MHTMGAICVQKLQWPAAMEETEVARAGQNASVFPSENIYNRSLFGVSGNLGHLRPKMDRRSSV